MMQYTLYNRGRQIDTFVVADDAAAIGWVESLYPLNEFGDSSVELYRNINGAGIHVATFYCDPLPL